jgi:hypothetical protein
MHRGSLPKAAEDFAGTFGRYQSGPCGETVMSSTHALDEMRCIVIWLKYCSTFDRRKFLMSQRRKSKGKILKGNSREER